jgi:hypothetical protein
VEKGTLRAFLENSVKKKAVELLRLSGSQRRMMTGWPTGYHNLKGQLF